MTILLMTKEDLKNEIYGHAKEMSFDILYDRAKNKIVIHFYESLESPVVRDDEYCISYRIRKKFFDEELTEFKKYKLKYF